MYCQSNNWWRFRKFLWPSQNICMNFNSRSEQFLKQNTNHLFFAGTKYFFDVGILLSEMGVCKLSSVDMLPAALRQNSVKLQWLNPILPSDSEYRNLRMVACDTTICDFEVSKVHILWEGHKILRNLHHRFVLCSNGQIYSGDVAKFCGLLKIYEL